jgi:GNAT superfamily N-acetyltransferase
MKMKILAHAAYEKAPVPPKEWIKVSLVPPTQNQMNRLLREAFKIPDAVWEPATGHQGVVTLRGRASGEVFGACSVLSPFFLHQVAVLPAYQGKGLGSYLIRAAADLFDLPYVVVQVDNSTQASGHTFWELQGFREIGE